LALSTLLFQHTGDLYAKTGAARAAPAIEYLHSTFSRPHQRAFADPSQFFHLAVCLPLLQQFQCMLQLCGAVFLRSAVFKVWVKPCCSVVSQADVPLCVPVPGI